MATPAYDPVATADTLWQQLTEYQPAVAAAIAMQLRALPENWTMRALGLARAHAALELPPGGTAPMEIVPYSPDWEDCPACHESGDLCRYHQGWVTGHEALYGPLRDASGIDPKVTVVDALSRLVEADEAAANGELAAAVDRLTEETG
ncbi:hypothetical protein [Kitasatospora sp. GP82]|uniref:hypothetical protein n=1 Tax=Kitasatospora sp. GP82 TaxID=3035089 RepID=UPI00247514FF|nr:hypothetical protein [Kitasatospora sp. GP82]MDH6129406.1 hypothetical protein [Kitasatospora sp. GP82]